MGVLSPHPMDRLLAGRQWRSAPRYGKGISGWRNNLPQEILGKVSTVPGLQNARDLHANVPQTETPVLNKSLI